jgi:predicted Zn-dependent protease
MKIKKLFNNAMILQKKYKFLLRTIIILFSIIIHNFILAKNLYAQISIIREAETEKLLREICYPIFKVAGLNTKNLKIYIVNDDSINAFVAGGQNIFVNSGLIKKFSDPSVIAGVIAHEIGHIASSHLAKSSEIFNENANNIFLGYLLGIGAIISGNPEVGSAILMGSSHIGNRLALKFNRSQEESADILALKYLEKLKLPTKGLLEIMSYFEEQSLVYKNIINPYELTHPASSSRIKLIKNHALKYKYANAKFDKKITKNFHQVKAKMEGFLDDIETIIKTKETKFDEDSQLSKAIAFFRKSDFQNAHKLIEELIKNNPRNGFLYELKAEFLFNENKIFEAILYYQKAINYLDEPSKTLSQIAFANAILELKTNDKFLLNLAIENLQKSQKYENDNALIFKSLASAYKLDNKEGKAYLMLAEYHYIIKENDKAQKLANEAIKEFEKTPDKVSQLRAQDLVEIIKNSQEKSKN